MQPSWWPTPSPIQCACTTGGNTDLYIIADTTCIPDDECEAYSEGIAELFSSIKGPFTIPRVAMMTYDGSSVHTVVELNDTDFNNYPAQRQLKGGVDDVKEFYNKIRDGINCQSLVDAEVDVISAIDEAFRQFTYEETTYLPPALRGRDKKIALFSTCEHSINSQTEDDVCDKYKTEEDRTVVGDEVEFTIFNVQTTTANVAQDYLYCLTEDDPGRQFFIGGANGITVEDFEDQVEPFANEICYQPTPSPTKRPTPSPVKQPTHHPTPLPTKKPTPTPTKRTTAWPTPASKPSCTCCNLGYKFKLEWERCSDWQNNTVDCVKDCEDYCDYTVHCYQYSLVSQVPACGKAECKEDWDGKEVSHVPDYVIFPHREDCGVQLDYAQYWKTVNNVSHDLRGKDITRFKPDEYAIYDSDPDKLTDATGIKIPVISWERDDQIHYEFEVYMFGDGGHVNVDEMYIGWGYNVEVEGKMGTSWDYGYKCLNSIALPDLCVGQVTDIYAERMGHMDNGVFDSNYHQRNYVEGQQQKGTGNYDDGHQQNENTSVSSAYYSHDGRPDTVQMQLPDFTGQHKEVNDYQFTFWDMARSHQPLIVLSVFIILVLGIFVSSFAYCIENKGAKPYGQVIKFVESDVDLDDQTDSELELIEDR